MRISIVTPVLNDTRIARALDSILAQRSAHDVELIVVDGGSTDGTSAVIGQYRDRIAVCISEPDNGIFDGMNKGIARATGDVVGILNADDWYAHPYVLHDVMSAFGDNAIEACYGDVEFVGEQGRVMRYCRAGGYSGAKWFLGWMPPHPAFFVRRRVYDRHGAFDTRFPISADYELMLRLLYKRRIGVAYLSQTLVRMAPNGNATRSVAAILRGNCEVVRAWQENGLRGGWAVPLLKLSRRPFQLLRPRLPGWRRRTHSRRYDRLGRASPT